MRTSFEIVGGVVDDPMRLVDELREIDGVAQAVDARCVAGRTHLEKAAELALTAGERGRRVADEASVEVLLYAAATRQIDRAIDRLGLTPDTREVGMMIHPGVDTEELRIERDDSVLDFRGEKVDRLREAFEIGDVELETVGVERLPLLVRERVVLSDLER